VKKAIFFLLLVFFIGMLYSLFLLSLTIFIIAGISLLYRVIQKLPSEKNQLWPGVLTMLCFMPFVIGYFISENSIESLKFLRLNASYFFVPLVIALIPTYHWNDVKKILLLFIGVIFLSSFFVLVNYLIHFSEMTASLGLGKSIVTPIDHVRYSILISFALVWSFILWVKKEHFAVLPRWVFTVIFLYLLVFVHVLAVRSGIILSYLGVAFSSLILFSKRKKPLLFSTVIGIIFLSPIIAYYSVPSFQNKIKYTIYDLKEFQKGKGADHSDSERLRSLVIGFEVWKESPIIGVGSGDLRKIINENYRSKYGENGLPKYPHNQFLKLLAISGIIGLLFYMVGFFGPFIIQSNFRNIYLATFILMILVSFLVEATLERSYSLAFYCIIVSLFYGMTRERAHMEG
jgi:O-antigen ligase